MNKLDGNQAGRNEQKKLAAYLRDKARHGEALNAQERNAAQKLGVDVKSGRASSKYSTDIWYMTEGGGIINGKEYSQHAMERMAPDTPSV